MPLKGIMKGGIGSFSRRSFEGKRFSRSRSQSAADEDSQYKEKRKSDVDNVALQGSVWGNMPPELVRDVIKRVEESESGWPCRKYVVACAGVCRTWRQVTKELVQAPEISGKLCFPISLKQPGSKDNPVQCFIKRDRASNTYLLYLGLSPTLSDTGKFLLAARKLRRTTGADYIISLDAEDMSRGSNTYVGKVRSNFLGTKFTIYDSQPPHSGAVASTSRAGRRVGSKQVSPRVPAGSYNVAHITYELNVLGTRGPRRMQCIMHSIPASSTQPGGSAPTPSDLSLTTVDLSLGSLPSFGFKSGISENMSFSEPLVSKNLKEEPLVLKNKAPRWHDQLQCWCLNFRGRVTVASVKNFQLVASPEPNQPISQNDHEKVILQFGKVGKDMFTMDYRYPLSAFQAFAICLSTFDTKLVCE
ncbi:hypothetical protein KI387_033769 [Taxus chinensis]|uniref:Tubby C-terminal domain-containing protein n=1 Tax=Taxus chinensis TaxID=29808 RepID=A0AA38BVF1_TAXCH|nr:hypothetical protein KI387_033769 [Taxus chinensis]